MHVARAKEEIEDLSGLGDRTEQRVIAASAFLLFGSLDWLVGGFEGIRTSA
jgi:hypothetical protein